MLFRNLVLVFLEVSKNINWVIQVVTFDQQWNFIYSGDSVCLLPVTVGFLVYVRIAISKYLKQFLQHHLVESFLGSFIYVANSAQSNTFWLSLSPLSSVLKFVTCIKEMFPRQPRAGVNITLDICLRDRSTRCKTFSVSPMTVTYNKCKCS